MRKKSREIGRGYEDPGMHLEKRKGRKKEEEIQLVSKEPGTT